MLDIVDSLVLKEIDLLIKDNQLLCEIIDSCNTHICAVCGKPIDQISPQRKTRSILWHDRKCYEYKPRKIIWLERTYGKDIVEVLIDTTKQCSDIKSQCAILNVSIPYLYQIIKKYCEEDHVSFFAKHSTGARKLLYNKKIKAPI